MNHEEIKERIRYFRQIARDYGHDVMEADRVYRLFSEITKLKQSGFEELKQGLFAKRVSDDITQLFKLQALKGSSYTIYWGLSLSYIPHRWEPKLQWHRTLKSSRFDLFEIAFDYLVPESSHWSEEEFFKIGSQHGEAYFKKAFSKAWNKTYPAALAWLNSAHSLKDIAEEADAQSKRKNMYHFPSPIMVYAFTLARTGELEGAKLTLERYYERFKEPDASRENLNAALLQIAKA